MSVETTSRPQADLSGGGSMLLLQPFRLGDLELCNRVVMAPLTRTRATLPGAIPNSLMREYYAQRATAGLIITEGTFVSDQARGWFGAPGVYTEAQRKGWEGITEAVHSAGGRIVVQLWHQGSVSSPKLVGNGRAPLGPSEVNPEQIVHTGYTETELSGVPSEMTLEDIRQAVQDFRHAAKVALAQSPRRRKGRTDDVRTGRFSFASFYSSDRRVRVSPPERLQPLVRDADATTS